MQRDEEEAWRAIVENYGERVLGPEAAVDEAEAPRDDGPDEPDAPDDPDDSDDRASADDPDDRASERDPDRFVPPVPPPQPLPSPDRGIAWCGVLGAPLILVVCVLASIPVPTWLAYLLVAGFVAGFGYLVLTMKSDPGDPWDDGARV